MQEYHNKRLLIISHEASYTGAPLLLLALIKYLVQSKGIKVTVAVVLGGPLEHEFSKWGNVCVLKPKGYSGTVGFKRWLLVIRNRWMLLKVFKFALGSDLILSNSIVNGMLLDWLRFARKPIYTYVHELKSVIDLYLKQGNAQGSFVYSKSFFYPCETVRKLLTDHYRVDPQKLHRLNYYFHADEFNITNTESKNKGALIICGVGTASFRKGTDIFIQIARIVLARNKHFIFRWFGSFENEEIEMQYRKMAISEEGMPLVEFAGSFAPAEMKKRYTEFDALLLTSREDTYPLVVLEAAFAKVPSLVFGSNGGIWEFVKDAGWIIETTDVNLMADCIMGLTRPILEEKGGLAYQKVISQHANKSLINQQIEFLLQ